MGDYWPLREGGMQQNMLQKINLWVNVVVITAYNGGRCLRQVFTTYYTNFHHLGFQKMWKHSERRSERGLAAKANNLFQTTAGLFENLSLPLHQDNAVSSYVQIQYSKNAYQREIIYSLAWLFQTPAIQATFHKLKNSITLWVKLALLCLRLPHSQFGNPLCTRSCEKNKKPNI